MKLFANENLFEPIINYLRKTVEETLELFKKHYVCIGEKDISKNLVIITADGVRIHRTTR